MLLARLSVALSDVGRDGLKTTATEQDCPAARLEPQALVKLKSAAFRPDRVRASEVRGALPELVRVTVWAAEATPSTVLGKTRALGERITLKVPVPVKLMASGGKAPGSVTVRAEGLKTGKAWLERHGNNAVRASCERRGTGSGIDREGAANRQGKCLRGSGLIQ